MDLSGLVSSNLADILSSMDLTCWFSLAVTPFLSSWSGFSLTNIVVLGFFGVLCLAFVIPIFTITKRSYFALKTRKVGITTT